jgi:hypothetical protein
LLASSSQKAEEPSIFASQTEVQDTGWSLTLVRKSNAYAITRSGLGHTGPNNLENMEAPPWSHSGWQSRQATRPLLFQQNYAAATIINFDDGRIAPRFHIAQVTHGKASIKKVVFDVTPVSCKLPFIVLSFRLAAQRQGDR